MAIQTGGDQGGIFASINITPLTDIFLVLLIIFMVATAVTIESAAHVDLPKLESPSDAQKPKGVTVTYTADHQIYVNGKNLSEDQLAPALRDALRQSSEKLVVFDGDPNVILEDMVRILDIAKSAGADKIALAVSPGPSEGGDATAPPTEPIAPEGGPQPEAVAPPVSP
ncbi:MAG TPA: biopolymer transporter ExbD [Candidatus Binataceae bacterium]|nr:biopolymer transporter ExbD [Candidatus Binataceae bacterium]